MLETFIRYVDALNERIGRVLACALPVMTVTTLLIIFFGSALRMGWVWMSEIVVYLHAIVFMLGAGYTLRHEGHVRIDVFYSRLSPRRRAWVDLLGVLLLLLPVCAVVAVYSFSYVADAWAIREHSAEKQGLPAVFLLKTCLLLMPLLLMLQGLSLAAKSYLVLGGKREAAAGAAEEGAGADAEETATRAATDD